MSSFINIGIASDPLTVDTATVTDLTVTSLTWSGIDEIRSGSGTVTSQHTLVSYAGNCVLTLPSASLGARREWSIKKLSADSFYLTLSPRDGALIDGAVEITLTGQ